MKERQLYCEEFRWDGNTQYAARQTQTSCFLVQIRYHSIYQQQAPRQSLPFLVLFWLSSTMNSFDMSFLVIYTCLIMSESTRAIIRRSMGSGPYYAHPDVFSNSLASAFALAIPSVATRQTETVSFRNCTSLVSVTGLSSDHLIILFLSHCLGLGSRFISGRSDRFSLTYR